MKENHFGAFLEFVWAQISIIFSTYWVCIHIGRAVGLEKMNEFLQGLPVFYLALFSFAVYSILHEIRRSK